MQHNKRTWHLSFNLKNSPSYWF